MNRRPASLILSFVAAAFLLGLGVAAPAGAALDNAICQSCHDGAKGKLEVPAADGKKRALLTIAPDQYGKAVHAKMNCVTCHTEIVDAVSPHKKTGTPKPECAQCHEGLWELARKVDKAKERPRLGVVAQNIEAYRKSFHAQPDKDHPGQPKAKCDQCHDSHFFDVPPKDSAERKGAWRLGTTSLCGESCHSDALDDYKESIHGQVALEKKDVKSAVCIDCHTSHAIATTSGEPFKVGIPEECGTCHQENLGSYRDTYHGQVNRLGYGYTAKCHDCHGSHSILKVSDKNSKVHPDNKLGTCRACHSGKKELKEATAGYASFHPHAHAGDFKRYPEMWITARFMYALLAGVFLFFWVHSALWFYREYQERKARLSRPHVRTEELPQAAGKQFRRFGPVVRAAHLLFALSVMMLVLTGMTVFYAETGWAQAMVRALGGPKVAGLIHRISAAVMLGIFALHLIYLVFHIGRNLRTFRWFGPDSLVPNWKDLEDIIGMFKWFVGKGPKPQFDRWTYWEKFDYWAVFWGMAIIGGSGAMLAFPTYVAAVLPGWTLNVATLVHGDEAFLAAVFLFTVHFFNNHFRAEKLPPPDVVMFTGSVALEEFRREHPLQYRRLLESGELHKYLVDQPSRPMTLGSKTLGLVLIAVGLVLLVMVAIGFFGA
jgi:cytochrome b subunit of formate dehydrogenase